MDWFKYTYWNTLIGGSSPKIPPNLLGITVESANFQNKMYIWKKHVCILASRLLKTYKYR